jgi:mRNA interferase RelE/StbE
VTVYRLDYDPRALKELGKIDKPIRRRIHAALTELTANPRPAGCRPLTGYSDLWRIRVGDYRAIYTIEDEVLVVLVLHVRHRREAYRDL